MKAMCLLAKTVASQAWREVRRAEYVCRRKTANGTDGCHRLAEEEETAENKSEMDSCIDDNHDGCRGDDSGTGWHCIGWGIGAGGL